MGSGSSVESRSSVFSLTNFGRSTRSDLSSENEDHNEETFDANILYADVQDDSIDFENRNAPWKEVKLIFRAGRVFAYSDDENIFSHSLKEVDTIKVNLPKTPAESTKNMAFVEIVIGDHRIVIKSDISDVHIWFSLFHAPVHIEKSDRRSYEATSLLFSAFRHLYDSDGSHSGPPPLNTPEPTPIERLALSVPVPPMNIVILVVGTRGDVQPFVYFGQALQRKGHRVRLATHAEYRADVVNKGGLEFYPLAGDPRKLSEYMVKTGGRLMPDLLNKEERLALPEKMAMLRDICFSCYPACTAPDPDPEGNQKPFLADAIVSNPVSYGHIHVAEAVCVPLHIMFPQPWSPTKCFPHPLSTPHFENNWCNSNFMSYLMLDEFMWLGLGSMINSFRKEVLHLPLIRTGERGRSLLNDNSVPISHMWSPTFVPKCPDWPPHVDVVGEFRPLSNASTSFSPSSELAAFLSSSEGSPGDKPLYVGFGSMVIEDKDAANLVKSIIEVSDKLNCRVLLQSGWTKYADENTLLSERVLVIGAMPHDWLFDQV